MSYALSMGAGHIGAGEVDWSWLPPARLRRSGYPAILVHGASTPDQFAGQGWPACDRIAARLAREGIACVAGYLGTNSANTADPWCNTTHMTRISSARTWLGTLLGATPAKVHLIGVSMGGGAVYRWASLNPTLAASVTGLLPMASLTAVYAANNPVGAQAGIGTAWGVTFPTSLPAGADLAAAATAMTAVPSQAYYASNDPYVTVSDVTALATAASGTATAFPVASGHTNASIAQLDLNALVAFLVAHGA